MYHYCVKYLFKGIKTIFRWYGSRRAILSKRRDKSNKIKVVKSQNEEIQIWTNESLSRKILIRSDNTVLSLIRVSQSINFIYEIRYVKSNIKRLALAAIVFLHPYNKDFTWKFIISFLLRSWQRVCKHSHKINWITRSFIARIESNARYWPSRWAGFLRFADLSILHSNQRRSNGL